MLDNIGIKSMDPDNYTDIKDEIKSMIEKTIEAGGIILLIHLYTEPEDVKVDGFINEHTKINKKRTLFH
jgi:hypothetical protein